MANRYRKESINGKTRFISDPNGLEMWQLKGYKTKPGVPANPNRRRSIHIKLPPDIYDWLHEQPEGQTAIIERAIMELMKKDEIL